MNAGKPGIPELTQTGIQLTHIKSSGLRCCKKRKGDFEYQFRLIKAQGKAVNAHSEPRVRPPQMEEVDLKQQRWTAISSGDERQVGSGGQVPAGYETQADSSVQIRGKTV